MFNSILAAIDGSANSLRALAIAAEMAETNDAELNIITVVNRSLSGLPSSFLELAAGCCETADSPNLFSRLDPDQLELYKAANKSAESTQRQIFDLIESLLVNAENNARIDGAKKIFSHISKGNPAEEILAYADNCDADVIVSGQKGLGANKKLALGSTAFKLVQLSVRTNIIVK